MLLRRTLALIPLVGIAFLTPAEAKDKKDKGSKNSAYSRTNDDWRRTTEDDRNRRTDEGWRNRQDRMRGLDTNNDGIVTRDEWRGNDQSFSRLDRDGNGRIDSNDRGNRSRNGKYRDEEWQRRRGDRFRNLDRNGDGVVSRDEFERR